jgi:hypothetical protein
LTKALNVQARAQRLDEDLKARAGELERVRVAQGKLEARVEELQRAR